MTATLKKFDWRRNATGDYEPGSRKKQFHATAKARLTIVAKLMGLTPDQYDIRSNKAGPAVSGEITLHTEHVYVQVCQSMLGGDSGILYRTCNGRKDYSGGRNMYMKLEALDTPAFMADKLHALALTSKRDYVLPVRKEV